MGVSYLGNLEEDDMLLFKSKMDPKTYELFYELVTREDEYGGMIPWPLLQIEKVLTNDGERMDVDRMYGREVKSKYFGYGGNRSLYAELYRVLGYVIYGYGNLSNNDRKRNGERTKRVLR